MQLSLPVFGHTTSWTRYGLVEGVVGRGSQCGARAVTFACVVPEPILTRFVTSHDRMPCIGRVITGVLRGRRVATADVPTVGAATKVKRPAAGIKALDTAWAAWRNRGIDRDLFCHGSARLRLTFSSAWLGDSRTPSCVKDRRVLVLALVITVHVLPTAPSPPSEPHNSRSCYAKSNQTQHERISSFVTAA